MNWKFYLANSSDLSHIHELTTAKNKSLSLVHNKGGTFSFDQRMSSEIAEYIQPFSTCVVAYRWNWRASMAYGEDVYECKWSGLVGPLDEKISDDSMNVNCVGWLNRLGRRMTRREKNYPYTAGSGTDDADIIFDLLAEVNGTTTVHPAGTTSAPVQEVGGTYTMYWPAGSVPNTPTFIKAGQKLPNEGPGGATAYVPAYRGKKYDKFQYLQPAFEELCGIENGCDIFVDPMTRELNVYRKRRVIRDDVVFGYNFGPSNVKLFGRQIDPSVAVNYMLVTGKAGTVPKYADDISSQQMYGPLEETANLSDVNDSSTASTGASGSTLWHYAAGEVAIRAQPRQIFSFTPFDYQVDWATKSDNGVPEPFVDYDMGDQVRLTAVHEPRIRVENLGVRVFGMKFSIDEEGNERLTELQTSP